MLSGIAGFDKSALKKGKKRKKKKAKPTVLDEIKNFKMKHKLKNASKRKIDVSKVKPNENNKMFDAMAAAIQARRGALEDDDEEEEDSWGDDDDADDW